jgi:tetratricopeptide (TPR) repeat protein
MKRKRESDNDDVGTDNQAPSVWTKLMGLMSFSFVDLAGELLDVFNAWRASRNWRAILVMLPFVLIILVVGVIAAIGVLSDRSMKVAWYVERAEKEVKLATGEPAEDTKKQDNKKKDDSKTSSESEPAEPLSEEELKTKTDFIDMLFRRVLQLEKNNKRALYYIAYQMSRYGKSVAARPIMESLAPEKNAGFSMAHAWLAADMLQRGLKGERVDKDVLKHHLKHGISQEKPPPGLQVAYSQLLQQDDQFSEAESVLKDAAKYEPKLLLNQIQAFNQRGMLLQAKGAADTLIDLVRKEFDGPKADEAMVLAAEAYLMTKRVDDAIRLLQGGIAKRPNSPLLRRGMSNACRVKFRETIEESGGQVKIHLELLNVAIVADPTNLGIQEDLNGLYRYGIGQSEETLESLRSQIAMNGTSFAARLIIAESSFRKGDLNTAKNQYEIILAEIPAMTLVLNNLAMLYLQVQPTNPEESLKLIDRAVTISPTVSEFHDSRGEILVALDRVPEAIESYKKALELNGERVETREKLIALYEKLGQNEEASKQRETLERVKQVVKQRIEKLEAERKLQEAQAKPNPQPDAQPDPALLTPEAKAPTTEGNKSSADTDPAAPTSKSGDK